MTTATSTAERLVAVRANIARACERAGRDPAEVTIVGVTKTQPVDAVREGLAAGLADFGENRVQELAPKAEAATAAGLTTSDGLSPTRWTRSASSRRLSAARSSVRASRSPATLRST